jgi:site-specific DNA-methyltransferase (adenine-specific)
MSSKLLFLQHELGALYQGDCREILPVIASSEQGSFDLVYADPPFNAGGKRGARESTGARATGNTAYSDSWGGIEGFLSMLEPRVAAVRDVMSELGSLWLHLDYRTVHDAKRICDRVFGRAAYKGEVIWIPGNGGRRSNGPAITHQTILVYANGKEMIWNADDACLREPYAETSLAMHFQHTDEAGRRYRERTIGGKTYRYYADVGRMLGSVWADCPAMRANTPLVRETTGYPTQKPEALLDRIIRAATTTDSRVLDPMCGSGTTLAVAARLCRRFVGIDRSPLAYEISARRLDLLTSCGRREQPICVKSGFSRV